ncbi:hypothetical protein DB347_02165 [Opitutaceae bacterium EW11]|nr:hypothetical protein DB347_02165 [Opitutaceae bacterium EW11]
MYRRKPFKGFRLFLSIPSLMSFFRYTLLLAVLSGLPAIAAEMPPALVGAWKYDPARSTELSPWKSYDLTIQLEGNTLTLKRRLGWARRDYADAISLDLSKSENVVPMPFWPDNRHIGAYSTEGRTARVVAQWLDDRRILRLSTDLILDAQQGPRAVNILSDYKLSANGRQLTLTELRSTRNRPVVYVFTRDAAKP